MSIKMGMNFRFRGHLAETGKRKGPSKASDRHC